MTAAFYHGDARLAAVVWFMLEKMRMYQAACALADQIEKLVERARPEAPNVADHLQRAADSVLFNMAEGIGAFRPKIKMTSYDISRREANEVRAALRRLVSKGVLSEIEIRKADDSARVRIAMLTNAIRAQETRKD